MQRTWLAVALTFALELVPWMTTAQEGGGAPAVDFRHPPADCRILQIIHGWPEGAADQDQWITRLQRQGFGGVVCNVSFKDCLQSPVQWAAFERAVKAARRAGLALWLYDEKGYPSGTAGGQVLRDHPEWEAEGLLAADAECGAGPVVLALPPGSLQFAAAFPAADGGGTGVDPARAVDLRTHLREGAIHWVAPAGRWQLLGVTRSRLYDGTHAEGNLAEPMPYPNLLLPEPTRRFLELTHGRYAARFGPDLGSLFLSTFTDEPSLMSLFLRRMPFRPIPWAANLPPAFRADHAYAIEDVLPSLFLDTGPAGYRHRHDFWLSVGNLVSRNFFGQIQETCHALRIRSGGHLLAEEGLTSHVALYGNFFACLRRLDAPSIDCLTSIPAEVPWHIGRLAASAAELEGKDRVMCEVSDHGQVWRPAGDKRPMRIVTEAEIRGTVNRLIVSGVNTLTSYYSFQKLDDEALRRLNAWVGRLCAWIRQGRSASEVAVVYPAESLAAHFLPGHHWANASPAANRIDVTFRMVLGGLDAARREFTVIDSQTLAEAEVRRGALEFRGQRWRVVVLPAIDTLPQAAWNTLERLSREGGMVLAVGPRPRSEGLAFPSAAVERQAERWLGPAGDGPAVRSYPGRGVAVSLPSGQELLLPDVIDRWLPAAVRSPSPAPGLRVLHRRSPEGEWYLVVNQNEDPWSGTLQFAARGAGRSLDPATGEMTGGVPADAAHITLAGYGAAGFHFPRAEPLEPAAQLALPRFETRPLKVQAPSVSRGEWVREEFTGPPSPDLESEPAWRAAATLARGGVDTFLFVRFTAPDPLDLSGASGVGFSVQIPEGQKPATQLLVVLKEADGGEYLAATPCSLASPGRMQLVLPFSHFTLAGWAPDANGRLDLERIGEIRIGWGGYHGGEGERVDFVTGPPRSVQVR